MNQKTFQPLCSGLCQVLILRHSFVTLVSALLSIFVNLEISISTYFTAYFYTILLFFNRQCTVLMKQQMLCTQCLILLDQYLPGLSTCGFPGSLTNKQSSTHSACLCKFLFIPPKKQSSLLCSYEEQDFGVRIDIT